MILIGSCFYDWCYEFELELQFGNCCIYYVCGKVFGGLSSINGMIFQWGNLLDYEKWVVKFGFEYWDYVYCLFYFWCMELLQFGLLEFDLQQKYFCGKEGLLYFECGLGVNLFFGVFFEVVE